MSWSSELEWIIMTVTGRSTKTHIFRMMLAAYVYNLWHKRNFIIFRKTTIPPETIGSLIVQEVVFLASTSPTLAVVVPILDYYP